MNKAFLAAIAAVALVMLLAISGPTKSVNAQTPTPDQGEFILLKLCDAGVEGPFVFDVNFEVGSLAVVPVAIPAPLDDLLGPLDPTLANINAVLAALEADLNDAYGSIELDCNEDFSFDLTTDLGDGLTVGELLTTLDALGVSLDGTISEVDLPLFLESVFTGSCEDVDLLALLDTGLFCVITNVQLTLADLDIEIEKVCVNTESGTFVLNLATAIDLSDAPEFLLDFLTEIGALDGTELDIDGFLGTINCDETDTFVLPEVIRLLLVAQLVLPIDFTVTLEELGLPEGVIPSFQGDCSDDGLLLDVALDLNGGPILLAIEIDDIGDLFELAEALSSIEAEFFCEITNEFPVELSSLRVNKDCVPANSGGSFTLAIDGDGTEFDTSASVICGGFILAEDLVAGEYTVGETAASNTLAAYTTFIVCTDGTSVQAISVDVDVLGPTECWVINYVNAVVTPPTTPPTLPDINIIIDNENNATQNQTNNNTQNQTNNQTNNQDVTTGDTNVHTGDTNVNTGGASGTGGSGTGGSSISGGSAPSNVAGASGTTRPSTAIRPPSTGDGGLASSNSSNALAKVIIGGLMVVAATGFALKASPGKN